MKGSASTCEDQSRMGRCAAAGVSALSAVVWLRAPQAALAAAPTCSPIDVQVDEAVRARWPALSDRIRTAFDGREDIDACALIQVTAGAGSTLSVTVVLPDGRSALRSARMDDLVPTLNALLLLPRVGSSAPSLAQARATTARSAAPSAPAAPISLLSIARPALDIPPQDVQRSTRLSSRASPPLRIELSLLTDARIGDGQTDVGVGADSLVELGDWLSGFAGRVDHYQHLASGPTGGALELAVLGGRRFRLQNAAVDLIAGPALALRGTEKATVSGPTGTTTTPSSEGPVPRGLLGARLNFGARSILRGFLGLEGEFGPASALGEQRPGNAPGLPTWTVGLALGGTVSAVVAEPSDIEVQARIDRAANKSRGQAAQDLDLDIRLGKPISAR